MTIQITFDTPPLCRENINEARQAREAIWQGLVYAGFDPIWLDTNGLKIEVCLKGFLAFLDDNTELLQMETGHFDDGWEGEEEHPGEHE